MFVFINTLHDVCTFKGFTCTHRHKSCFKLNQLYKLFFFNSHPNLHTHTHTHTHTSHVFTLLSYWDLFRHKDDRDETFVKFLLPNFVSGMVIGSAGSTVSKLMHESNTVIKFSPGRELYPGTTDRVCVIIGSIPDICKTLEQIFSLLIGSSHVRSDELQDSLRHFRMLISNISSGMVIGKSGQTIKSIQSDCGVKIQITNKDDTSLPERTLTVDGATEAIIKAVQRILEHTSGDPDSNKWKRLLSYSGYTASPTSSSKSSHTQSTTSNHGAHSSMMPPSSSSNAQQSSAMAAVAALGYSSAAAAAQAANNLSDPTTAFLSLLQQQQQHQQHQQQQQQQSLYGFGANATQTNSSASVSLYTQALMSHAYSQSLMATSTPYSHFNPVMIDGVNLMVPGATLCTFEIALPEVMVTTVMGVSGKLITDLTQTTGARVQLSGKGEYIPGTYNRKLTITGPILSVQAAHMVVTQKILKEQEMFMKQGLI